MEHIAEQIIKHTCNIYLSARDYTSETEILDVLQGSTNLGVGGIEEIDAEKVMREIRFCWKSISSSEVKDYYVILYQQDYVDHEENLHHLNPVIFVPFGIWRDKSETIGCVGDGIWNYHWKAYTWSSQKHKKYATFEDLENSTDNEKTDGLVAQGYGNKYQEKMMLPPIYHQDKKRCLQMKNLHDTEAHSIRVEKYQKQNPGVVLF